MRALTLIQPWATAIMHLGKTVENRDWAPPSALVGKRIALHAGKKLDREAFDLSVCHFDDAEAMLRSTWLQSPPLGAIVGTVVLVGCVRIEPDGVERADDGHRRVSSVGLDGVAVAAALNSRWRSLNARALWVVRDPRPLAQPLPCKGALGLWTVPTELVAQMEAQGV